MLFSFSNFQFDIDKKLLTQDGEVVQLNEKPAQLLCVFLLDPETLHQKADLLDKVWPERVVTDQVVFQNINSLRKLFGNDAIKTYSKKGYQWQLPITEISHTKPAKIAPPSVGKSKVPWIIILVACVCGTLLYSMQENTASVTSNVDREVVLITSTNVQATPMLNPGSAVQIKVLQTDLAQQQLLDSPYKTWQKLRKKNSWLITTRYYPLSNAGVLRFHVQGAMRGWHGYILGDTEAIRYQQLNRLLAMLSEGNYLEINSDHAALAYLSLLQNDNPDDLLLNYQLIALNFSLGNLDRAAALTEIQISKQENQFHRGLFSLLHARISMWNDNWQAALESTAVALELFNSLNLPQLIALATEREAWIKYYYDDNQGAMQSLNTSASFARVAKEPLQEINAYLVQAFLASKLNQQELMLTKLDLTNKLIDMHQLDEEHRIAMSYYTAWGKQRQQDKLEIYESMLSLPYSKLYENHLYTAAEFFRNTFIEYTDLERAKMSIKPWQRRSFVALSNTHIAFANNDTEQAVDSGIIAFRFAQVDQVIEDALDAALLLIRYDASGIQVDNVDAYSDYIRQNATHRWLRQNDTSLTRLGILNKVN